MAEGILRFEEGKYYVEYINANGKNLKRDVKKTNVSKDIIEDKNNKTWEVVFEDNKKPEKVMVKGKTYISWKNLPSKKHKPSSSPSGRNDRRKGFHERNLNQASSKNSITARHNRAGSDNSAPYNFIQINETVVKDPCDYTFEKFQGLSGKIECEIETKTPLFISGSKPENDKYNRFVCYEDGQPVIPSSSLKGMLRNVIEILSFSKITEQNSHLDRYLVYRDVAGVNYINNQVYYSVLTDAASKQYKGHAGILKKDSGNYYIIPAEYKAVRRKYLREEFKRLRLNYSEKFTVADNNNLYFKIFKSTEPRKDKRSGRPLKDDYGKIMMRPVDKAELSKSQKNDFKKCKMLITGPSIGQDWQKEDKRDYIIYNFESDKNKWLEISEKVIRNFKIQISQFQENRFGNDIAPNQPVFYTLKDNKVNFFGRCKMLRIPYNFKIQDFVPDSHRKNILDFADKMFGFIRKNDDKTNDDCAGKIFISDAKLTGNPKYAGTYETILGTPNPTSWQLYLEQDRPGGNPRSQLTYNSKDKTRIRGHKMYWHKNRLEAPEPNPKEKIKTFMENVLETGNTFTFTIEFMNMSEEETGLLMLALNLWGEQYCHKIGMGKPYGLGSIKIKTDKFQVINREKRYRKIIDESGVLFLGNEEKDYRDFINKFEEFMTEQIRTEYSNHKRIKQLKKIMDFNEAGNNAADKVYMNLSQFRNKGVLPEIELV